MQSKSEANGAFAVSKSEIQEFFTSFAVIKVPSLNFASFRKENVQRFLSREILYDEQIAGKGARFTGS